MGVEAFIEVKRISGTPFIVVNVDNSGSYEFPLTKRGAIEAGKFLHKTKLEHWMCSSSMDFPYEVKRGFKHDIRELMREGYEKEQNKNIPARVFWFHYNKPASLKQGRNILTVHQGKTCHLVTGIFCTVPIKTEDRKTQPRCILKGTGVVRIVDGIAYIDQG